MYFPANGSGEWTESGAMGEWPGPFGILLRRDRDAGGRPTLVPRPWRLGKLGRYWPGCGRYGFIWLLAATQRRLGTVRLR